METNESGEEMSQINSSLKIDQLVGNENLEIRLRSNISG